MRTIFMAVCLALAVGLFMPAKPAMAAAGDYDRGTGFAAPSAHGYGYRYHRGHSRRYYRYPRRGYGVYFYYAPRPRVRRHYRAHRTYRRSGSRCGYWRQRCAANWGYGGSNFRGCLRYHRC